jgi:dihydrofolate synthase/folylpolyglutamate synthase
MSLTFDHLHIVWGMVKDKEIGEILSLLPKEASYYFCQAKIPRAMDAETLEREAGRYALQGKVIRDVNEAKNAAWRNAGPNDVILIGGSTFVVAELQEL